MKAKHCIFPMLAGFICACSNDFLPEFDDTCEWNTSLEELVTDNAGLFASRNIEITGSRLLKDVKPDSTLFFGEDYGYFPVYSKKDSVFEVIKYEDSMKSDGSTLNINAATERIRSLIERADDYNVIELTWRYGNESFKSLALFDKRTGELEYDNMLFNMETITQRGADLASLLYIAEDLTETKTGTKRLEYFEHDSLKATAVLTWTAMGHWMVHDHAVSGGIIRDYIYKHEHVSFHDRYSSTEIGYSTFVDIPFQSPANYDDYYFWYVLVGAKSGSFLENVYHMNYGTSVFNGTIPNVPLNQGCFSDGGSSILDSVYVKPYRASIFIPNQQTN